ncbi:uncharacterized protein [Emydura macquarii macquarii]|uniref:uncharacterized protein isoform X1 n=1 Tax=Emydura macquarii macquarii TaxID=1129001 RepID=UPI003529E973
MGCGGSRTDGLEPRYRESWTKETESTWLTSTDADIPLSSLQTLPPESCPKMAFGIDKSTMSLGADFFDDGFPNPAQSYLKVCSVMSDSSFDETKAAAGESQVTNKPLNGVPPTGTAIQKRSVLCTEKGYAPSKSFVPPKTSSSTCPLQKEGHASGRQSWPMELSSVLQSDPATAAGEFLGEGTILL